jgi:hypothetical protein
VLGVIQFTLNTTGFNCTLDLECILSTVCFDMWIARTLTVIITAHVCFSAVFTDLGIQAVPVGILKDTQSCKTSVTLCSEVGPVKSARRENRLQNRP